MSDSDTRQCRIMRLFDLAICKIELSYNISEVCHSSLQSSKLIELLS